MSGAAQRVTREGKEVWVLLSCGPACTEPSVTYGPCRGYRFAEPVEFHQGDRLTVVIGCLGEEEQAQTALPMFIPGACTVAWAVTGPSYVRPGHLQLAVAGLDFDPVRLMDPSGLFA